MSMTIEREAHLALSRASKYAKLCPDQQRRTAKDYAVKLASEGQSAMQIAATLRKLPFSLTNDDSRVVAGYARGTQA